MTKRSTTFVIFSMLLIANQMRASDVCQDWNQVIVPLQEGIESWAFVDLNLSEDEIASMQKIEISHTIGYGRFTKLHLIEKELPSFLKAVGSHDSKLNALVAKIIQKTSIEVVDALGKETAWVSVRASSLSNLQDKFEIPRWHTDGGFFEPFDSIQVKFASVIKGPTTIFASIGDLREKFNSIQEGDLTETEKRSALHNMIDKTPVINPRNGQGAFFVVGGTNCSAIHSEPFINEDRLFFSVVAGTEEEIRELAHRWNQAL